MIPLSFWMGVYSREKIIIHLQADLIQAQKAHKESLRKEAEYLKTLEAAFGKTYDTEKQRWINAIATEVKE